MHIPSEAVTQADSISNEPSAKIRVENVHYELNETDLEVRNYLSESDRMSPAYTALRICSAALDQSSDFL